MNDDDVAEFRAPQVCRLTGITYRQLDYWCRTGLIEPAIQSAAGSGSQRLFSTQDVVMIRLVRSLCDAGMRLHTMRRLLDRVAALLSEDDVVDLRDVTLVASDTKAYAVTSPRELDDTIRQTGAAFTVSVAAVIDHIEAQMVYEAAEFKVASV